MGTVTTKVAWNGGQRFTGTNATGHETVIDGDSQAGPSPVQLLLEALGACAAVDVVGILEKSRTPAQKLEISLTGARHEPEPRYYTQVAMHFDIWGAAIRPETVTRAVNLSITKYCSVYHSLRGDLKLQPAFRLHAPEAEAAGDYQVVEIGIPTGDLG